MTEGFIVDITDNINMVVNQYIAHAYHAVVLSHTRLFDMMLVIGIAGYGWGISQGYIRLNPVHAARKVLLVTLLYSLATQWHYYRYIVDAFMEGGDHLIQALLSGKMAVVRINTASDAISTVFSHGVNLFNDIWRSAGIYNIGAYVIATFGYLLIGIMTITALSLLILAKLILSVLLAIGPIFLMLALYKGTFRLFDGWVKELTTWFIIPVLLFAVIGLFMSMLDQQVLRILALDEGPDTTQIWPVFVLTGMTIYAFRIIPDIASQLAGTTLVQAKGVQEKRGSRKEGSAHSK